MRGLSQVIMLCAVLSATEGVILAQGMTVVGQPSYSDGCGPTPAIKITSDNKIELVLPQFEAVTTAENKRIRKNCVITAMIQAPAGYKLAPATLAYEGAAKMSEQGSGNITARYYFTGTASLAGYKRFEANYDDIFDVNTHGESPLYTACGGQAEFNFMGDIVARDTGSSASEVVVHRGHAETNVSEDTPVIQCGIKVVRCR